MIRRAALVGGILLLATGVLHADELEVRSGKTYRGHARRSGREILLNEYGCSAPEMTLGVRRLRAIDVRAQRPWPLEDHLQRVLLELGSTDVARRVDLLREARSGRLRGWTERLAAEILAVDPKHVEALDALGGAERWAELRRGNPRLVPALGVALRRLLRLESGVDRRDRAGALAEEFGYEVSVDRIERMARSLRPDRGLQERIPLRLEAEDHDGAWYARHVPPDYDATSPRPLLIALHGGGIMHAAKGEIRGSPKDALALYLEDAARLGWFVVCPQAVESPWGTSKNLAMLEDVLAEITARWNIDLERIHLAGQGGGGDGAWSWAMRKADRFASVSIASAGKPTGYASIAQKTALWLYHGDADEVVPIEPVRKAASALRKRKAEFVYCELPKEAHGLAPAARRDMIRYIAPKRRRRAREAWPRSSFDIPSTRQALKAFGDPAAAWGHGLADDLDAAALLARLRAGRTDAEHAARRLMDRHERERETLGPKVRRWSSRASSSGSRTRRRRTCAGS